MSKGFLQYMRPQWMRDSVKVYRVVEGATMESLNRFCPGCAFENENTLYFKGKSSQVSELRLRHHVNLREI